MFPSSMLVGSCLWIMWLIPNMPPARDLAGACLYSLFYFNKLHQPFLSFLPFLGHPAVFVAIPLPVKACQGGKLHCSPCLPLHSQRIQAVITPRLRFQSTWLEIHTLPEKCLQKGYLKDVDTAHY